MIHACGCKGGMQCGLMANTAPRVFDQRDHAHLRAAFRADERIDLVDFANQLRPGGLRGLARVAVGFSVGLVHFGTFVLRAARPA
jgi:hypothetical protein